jgi:hypothetical protein
MLHGFRCGGQSVWMGVDEWMRWVAVYQFLVDFRSLIAPDEEAGDHPILDSFGS